MLTFDTRVTRFQVGLQIGRTYDRRGEERLQVEHVTMSPTGALAGEYRRDVGAAPDVPVVGLHAPVQMHPTVAGRFYDDDLIGGTLNFQLLFDAVVAGCCYK